MGIGFLHDLNMCVSFNYFKSEYGDKVMLLLTDLNGLVCEIKTRNLHKDFFANKDMFHFDKY